ncbi:MAG: hypothetical protein QOE32_7892, partial [Pseudonocardiales bacterium]|nr:hypothetical protein [Pseudonocardiales bacterium]
MGAQVGEPLFRVRNRGQLPGR